MIETFEKNINGDIYTITQLPARRAIKLKAKLIKMFGAVLAQIFIAANEKLTEEEKKRDLVSAVELLSTHMDENSFENLIVEMLQGVRKNGMELTPATIDMEFAGDMATLYLVVWAVLEVNYANFFTMVNTGNQSFQEKTLKQDTKKTFVKK